MPTVDSTVGGANSNSYADVATVDAYASTRIGSDTWLNADPPDKETAVIQSTRIIDQVFDWHGWKASDTQALLWPRSGVIDPDQAFGNKSLYDVGGMIEAWLPDNILPKYLVNGTCELAVTLIGSEGYNAEINDLKLVRVGPLRVDFAPLAPNFALPNTVVEMLRKLGIYAGIRMGVVTIATMVRV